MTIPYVSGTVSVTAGSAIVTGVGTGWQTGLVTGGMFGLDSANGNPVPILSIDNDTQLTLAKPWRGTTAAGQAYWIMRDTAYGQQTVANSNALATIINELRNPAVAALAAVSAQLAAGKVPRGLSATVMEMFTVSDFAKTFLDETDAAGVRAVLAAQAALGFTPVQQGGGTGQGNNKIYFGWSGTQIKAQVDWSDLGTVWTNFGVTLNLAGNGYIRFPNGIIIQWGYNGGTGADNTSVPFPIAFPAGPLSVTATVALSGVEPATTLHTVMVGTVTNNSFNIQKRFAANGGLVGFTGVPIFWLALGY